jgi:hypothetical protein
MSPSEHYGTYRVEIEMTTYPSAGLTLIIAATLSCSTQASFVVELSDADFVLTNTFNQVSEFRFTLTIDADLFPGGVYNNPPLTSIDYSIRGVLPNPTPSGFPGFFLVRSMTGVEFYNLSPESGLSFFVLPTANLADGLQASELAGGTIFALNARELNQDPGRYHPPLFELNSDGTGLLTNANNKSTFKNPDPPMGSGMLVDVAIGDEYVIDLTFTATSVTLVSAIPEPSAAWFLLVAGVAAGWLRAATP